MLRRISRLLLRLIGLIAALLLLYVACALLAALAPRGGRVQALNPDDPVIYVCANLAHADIVVPLHDPAVDWPRLFPDLAAAPADAYLAIGWGDLGVYLNTPQWRDLRPGVAVSAALGLGPTTLHVLEVDPAGVERACRKLRLDRAGRRALAGYVTATARLDATGAAVPLASPRWGEVYYAALGRYAPWRTCNVWASDALAAAGAPTAVWAPFSFGVDWPLQ